MSADLSSAKVGSHLMGIAGPLPLLPGETLSTAHSTAKDAAHWTAEYTELRSSNLTLMTTLREAMGHLSLWSQDEFERSDAMILEFEAAGLGRRLAIWQARVAELN